MATFAPGGPETCSGLPVMRYSPETLGATLGQGFRLLESIEETHSTPWNTDQAFSYTRWLRDRRRREALAPQACPAAKRQPGVEEPDSRGL